MASFKLDRRTLLRGIGGAAIGLPVLECMLNGNGTAYAQGMAIPKRYALVFAGQAIGGDGWPKDRSRVGGVNRTETGHFIAPAETGSTYTVTTPLIPLRDLNLLGDFTLLSNMRIPWNSTSADGADVPSMGAFRDFHGGGCSPLLSGMRSTSPNFTCNGPTSDQVVAQMHAGQTLQGSLVYRAQPSWYLSGSSYSGREFISYRGTNNNATRVPAQPSPQVAFTSLFSGFTPPGDDAAVRADFARRQRLSVLDLISSKRQAILGKVGAADRARLTTHFDEIRALELRVQMIQPPATGTCIIPSDPGTDPPIGGDNAGSDSGTIGTNTGYSDETTRARVFADLIHMAFTCDLSRVATLQITTFQSHMNVFELSSDMGMPLRADQHEVGHNGDADNRGQLAVSTLLRWHIQTYAYLIDKLKRTQEGAGNVLDNCSLVFLPEAGHGTQLNDASTPDATHSVENMIAIVAGRAGGLRPGKHVDTAGAHPVQALIGAMRGAGYTGDALGEVTGHINELFT